MTDFKEVPLFRTMVPVTLPQVNIKLNDGFVFLGSCFAQYVGGKFQEYGMPTIVNPLGTLYNPASIDAVISNAVHEELDAYIFPSQGRYFCWLAGTQISAESHDECKQIVGKALAKLKAHIVRSKYLFLTLGTNVAYVHHELNTVVSNCHRMPQKLFLERKFSLSECVSILKHIVASVQSLNPDMKVIFTVSPYRYAKYGFHGSQLAKSTLLLAVDALCKAYPDVCHYFPSYEILLDELRDYRFYASDMLHPSPDAVDYIWNRLVANTFDQSAIDYLNAFDPLRKGLMHRSFNADCAQEEERLRLLGEKVKALQEKFGITPIV